jgi:HSP90 family molecular chaperone
MVSKLLTRAQLELLLKSNDKSIKLKKVEQTEHGSSFWPKFSLVLVNDIIQDFVLCDKCRSIITYKSSTGTGGLKKHLISCEKHALSSSNTTQSTITTYYSNMKPSILPEKLKKEITNAYVDFIALDSRPFEIACDIGFKQFLQAVYNAGKSSSNTQSIEISDFLPHPTTVSISL